MRDLVQQIVALEEEIEDLSAKVRRCQKTILLGKVAATGGGFLLLALMAGFFRSQPVALVLGITALLGGIALFGTGGSPLEETEGRIKEREMQRTQIINGLKLEVVEDR